MENSEEKFLEGFTRKEHGVAGEAGMKVELAKATSVASKPKINTHEMNEDVTDLENEPEGQLTIDVYQTPAEIVVESAVAGVEPEDLDINVTNDSVTVRGRRHKEKNVKDEDYFYQECYWGRFARSVILPQEVDAENSYASFKNGILAIHMPKLSRQKMKKIKVRME